MRRLPLHRRRARARGGARPAPRCAAREQRPGDGDRRVRLSRVHDVGRLARLRRREGRDPRPRSRRVRVHAREDEGRQRPRLRRPPRRADPPRARPERNPDDGRQPGVGRRRGDRRNADARRPRALVDRGADEPGRRARHARIRREIAPVRVATGEHIQNRVVFKQLFQAEAIDVCQLDACRVGGVNEAISVLLLAAKFGVPVCPHAAASDCASTSSTSRSSTTSRSAARPRTGSSSGSTISTSTSAIRPSSATAVTWPRPRPGTASRCCRSRSTSSRSPTGRRGPTSLSPSEGNDGGCERAEADAGGRIRRASTATGCSRSGSGRSVPARR